jgi:hypothetical protein
MPRGRGGKRQGTPGMGYSNRTDLISNYDQQEMTAAAGGMEAKPDVMPLPAQTPEDTPNLADPTQFPNEPLTTGLTQGPGDGPRRDTRLEETQNLKKYLPLLETYLDQPETPDSVRRLFRYIRGS